MAEITSGIAFALGTQATAGSYNDALDADPATLTESLTPGADSQVAGLLLGDAASGEEQSGLNFAWSRVASDKAIIGTGFTRPLSDFERLEINTFEVTVPFCGNRSTLSSPTDADYEPNPGLVALLNGMGLTGANWGGGDGRIFQFDPASASPFSALVFFNGLRWKLLDCRCTGRLRLTPAAKPLLTATIRVGSIHEVAEASLPTLTYDPLDDESPPVVGTPATGFTWGQARSFNDCELNITPTIGETPDSEAADGLRKSLDDIVATMRIKVWEDDADDDFGYQQAIVTSDGSLAALSFQVGATAGDGEVAKAVQFSLPKPEEQGGALGPLDKKAAGEYNLIARHTAANQELAIIFL